MKSRVFVALMVTVLGLGGLSLAETNPAENDQLNGDARSRIQRPTTTVPKSEENQSKDAEVRDQLDEDASTEAWWRRRWGWGGYYRPYYGGGWGGYYRPYYGGYYGGGWGGCYSPYYGGYYGGWGGNYPYYSTYYYPSYYYGGGCGWGW